MPSSKVIEGFTNAAMEGKADILRNLYNDFEDQTVLFLLSLVSLACRERICPEELRLEACKQGLLTRIYA
jgi:hypothetical protein